MARYDARCSACDQEIEFGSQRLFLGGIRAGTYCDACLTAFERGLHATDAGRTAWGAVLRADIRYERQKTRAKSLTLDDNIDQVVDASLDAKRDLGVYIDEWIAERKRLLSGVADTTAAPPVSD